MNVDSEKLERVMDAFRRWGYLQANLDPLGHFAPLPHPELDVSGEEAEAGAPHLRGTIGVEFMHIADPERRGWIQERMESSGEEPDRPRPRSRPTGARRRLRADHPLPLHRNQALLAGRQHRADPAARRDPELPPPSRAREQAVLAMSHRGRLNVIINIVNRPAAEIFAGFEDVDPRSVLGGGDVKYHIGATGIFTRRQWPARCAFTWSPIPATWKRLIPWLLGRARAKQTRLGRDGKAEGRADHHARRRRLRRAGNYCRNA